jgi:hypothetical protein
MSWEIIALGILIVLGFGVALFMARKTKPLPSTVVHADPVDIDVLAAKVAGLITADLAKLLSNLPKHSMKSMNSQDEFDDIQIDERIIPLAIKSIEAEGDLTSSTKEEIEVDKDINKSKSRLAELLKSRK